MLRFKGYFWISTRNDIIGLWSQAEGSDEYRPCGYWWAAAPKSTWPDDDAIWRLVMKDWEGPYGDRRQILVYIGQDLPKEEMIRELEGCLLDPFPAWSANLVEA